MTAQPPPDTAATPVVSIEPRELRLEHKFPNGDEHTTYVQSSGDLSVILAGTRTLPGIPTPGNVRGAVVVLLGPDDEPFDEIFVQSNNDETEAQTMHRAMEALRMAGAAWVSASTELVGPKAS